MIKGLSTIWSISSSLVLYFLSCWTFLSAIFSPVDFSLALKTLPKVPLPINSSKMISSTPSYFFVLVSGWGEWKICLNTFLKGCASNDSSNYFIFWSIAVGEQALYLVLIFILCNDFLVVCFVSLSLLIPAIVVSKFLLSIYTKSLTLP